MSFSYFETKNFRIVLQIYGKIVILMSCQNFGAIQNVLIFFSKTQSKNSKKIWKIFGSLRNFFWFTILKKLNNCWYVYKIILLLKKEVVKSKKDFYWKFIVNVRFSRFFSYGDFEPIGDNLSSCGGLRAWAWLFV